MIQSLYMSVGNTMAGATVSAARLRRMLDELAAHAGGQDHRRCMSRRATAPTRQLWQRPGGQRPYPSSGTARCATAAGWWGCVPVTEGC